MERMHVGKDAPRVLQQLGRAALLGNLAVFQNDDLIRRLDGTHPVCDDQNGFACQQAGQGALHPGLVLHIQGRRRLVQQDDGGVFQQRPGDGNALPLTAGELGPVLADRRRVPFGKS